MKNKNGNKFIWGNYDYSNDLSKDIISNIPNTEPEQEKEEEKNDKNFLNPIKTKIKEGIEKITSSELTNKIKDKLTSKNQNRMDNNISQINYSLNFQNNEIMYEDEEDFQIKCIIDEYVDKVIGKDHVIFYKIELSSSLSGKNWEVFRSIQEFSDLYLIYQKLYLDVPIIKWPNLSTIRKEPIVHRQLITQLNSFINEILEKPGLLTAPFLLEFLELQNHHTDLIIYKPILRYDSNFDEMYSNNLIINDVLFLEEPKLLLIGTGLLEGEIINNNNEITNEKSGFFNNIKKIGKIFSSNKEEKANTCKGKFYIYNLIKNNNLELMLVELKRLEVISQIVKIDFFSENNIIILGLDNGQILIFEIFIKNQNPNSQDILEYIGTINYHINPILCCLFNFQEGYIYSFAKHDTCIKICEYNYQTLIKEFSIYNNNYKKSWRNKGIICVDYTISYEYIYIQDEEGNIFFIDIIYDSLNPYIISFFPKFLKDSNENNKGKILEIKNSFYLFIGENSKNKIILNIYLILINEFNSNNTNEQINLVKMKEINLNGDFFITNIRLANNYEIIISLSNGTICVYNHSNKHPEYFFIYHQKKLTNFIWFEKQKSIISVSFDRSIKIYQIPLKWPAELIRKNERINEINIIKDMIGESKNIFHEFKYQNKIKNKEEINIGDNIEEDNNNINENKDEKNEKINKKYIWDIGNLNLSNSNEIQDNNGKYYQNDYNNEDLLYLYDDNNLKKFDGKSDQDNKLNFDNYHEYFNIFSDDLDGWSE